MNPRSVKFSGNTIGLGMSPSVLEGEGRHLSLRKY